MYCFKCRVLFFISIIFISHSSFGLDIIRMSKHDVKILEKLADTSFEAELLGVTCKRGMIGIGGRVELRNITILSGELNGTIVTGREEIEIRVSDEVCSEIYENIGNCTKQYATLTTNDELEVISISNIHFREGARVCL